MDIDCSKGSHGKPHHIASRACSFNIVVDKQSLVSTFHRCPGIEFVFKSSGITGNRREHSGIIVGFYINYFTVGTLGTQTVGRRFLAMASKPAAVLDTFRFTVTPVLIGDTTRTYRSCFVIEAKDVDEGS